MEQYVVLTTAILTIALALAVALLLVNYCGQLLIRWLNTKRRPVADPFSVLPMHMQALSYSHQGETDRALTLANKVLATLKLTAETSVAPWQELNSLVNVYVNAGAYEQALHFAEPWAPGAHADRELDFEEALLLINQAEALHNLGRDSDALTYLHKVEARIDNVFAVSGLKLLRIWILAHHGDLLEANQQMDTADFGVLARTYSPEIACTQAALLREQGEFDLALAEIERDFGEPIRASSRRNGLIMRASIYAAKGDHATALPLFEQAFALPYKAQAAYGILRFAAMQSQTQGVPLDRQNDLGAYQIDFDSLPEDFRVKWLELDPESKLSMRVYPRATPLC